MLTPSTNNILLENTTDGESLTDISKVIKDEVPSNSLSDAHPMLKFAGIFKDDADFAAVVAHIAKERERSQLPDSRLAAESGLVVALAMSCNK
jgi:hypothetical protein